MSADDQTSIRLTIASDIGGSWYLLRQHNSWVLSKTIIQDPTSAIIIQPDDAWRLFSKSLRPEQVKHNITITGNQSLGEVALNMVSVMA